MRESSRGQEFPQPWKTVSQEIKSYQKIKSNKHIENYVISHHSKTSENQQQDNLKKNSKEKEGHINCLETKVTVTIDFSPNIWKYEDSNGFFKLLNENICQPEYYIQSKYSSK